MRVKIYFIIGPLLILFPLSALASSVVINEVMFNPAGDDTGGEWVELYNGSNEQVDVSGWEVYPDGIGYVTVPNGFSIGAKKFMLIHLRLAGNNSSADIYETTASSNMSNTSGSVALFSGEPKGKDTIKSFVQWGRAGETWESTASTSGLWEKNTFVDLGSFAEGNSIVLTRDGISTGRKDAWSVAKAPTPGAYNNARSFVVASDLPGPSASPSDNTTSSASSPPPSPLAHAAPIKTIKAYAGENTSSMVGALIDFLGRAKGVNDESLDSSARFFWNFGDGETQEGRSVAHTYHMPGIYTAALYVSSGEYAASDYTRIEINPNLVSVSDVVQGPGGYLRLKNASDIEADISSWNIRDGKGQTFIVPPRTKMARRGEIAIMNSVSGLLKESPSLPLNVFYPNGVSAFDFSGTSTATALQNIKENIRQASPRDIPIAEVKKSGSIIGTGGHPRSSFSPLPAPPKENDKQYAPVTSAPFVSLPFGIALGVSMLGAAGFIIAKLFLQ